jgi:peroxiredoxin
MEPLTRVDEYRGFDMRGAFPILKSDETPGRARMKATNRAAILALSLSVCALGVSCKTYPTTASEGSLLSFSGTVSQGGQAFPGVDVYLSWDASKTAFTASDGKFEFSDLPGGNYIVTPSRLGLAFSPSNYEIGSASRSDLTFSASAATYGTEEGTIALDFTAKDQNGANVTLSNYHGKVILLDFTADWCSPCREKAETAESFYQGLKNKGFIYILCVIEGSPRTWADTYGLTFPVLDDNSHAVYNYYRKSSIPLPHVLDRNRTIRYKREGYNKPEVEATIAKYL